MRNFFLIILGIFLFWAPGHAQNETTAKAVKWQYEAVKQGNNNYELVFKASIDKGWKLFSITMKDDEPNTRVKHDSASLAFITVNDIKEAGDLKSGKEPSLGDLPIRYFENNVSIKANITVKQPGKDIKGVVTYMAIKGDSVIGPEDEAFRFSFDAGGNLAAKQAGLTENSAGAQSLKRTTIDVKHPVNNCGGTGAEGKKGFLAIFLIGFLGGLVGLFMPCTFPMIPLTVSFFTKKSGNRQQGIKNAFLYGFFIFLIYLAISIPFYFLDTGSSGLLNSISTNAWLNIGFAVVFIAFALSFFGLYEIVLPSDISNSADAKSSIGSIGGIFFMALTLAIVSFSCTGPILGTLLVGALNQEGGGGAINLTFALAGFGLALGLPFALFALFPNWLSSLPKSGSWMNTLKIVFGFVELALALKYLSNADLVMHWGLLKRETFFAIWILIGLAVSLYLFGILKFSYDPPPKKLSKGRIIAASLFLAFTIYLLPGLTKTKYANLALVSGFPPPLDYSLYKKNAENKEVVVINDYEKALKLAKELHKPILIDFTGWACVNCRKMEENVWPDARVKALIDQQFIRVSLYVDDRKALPDNEQFLYTNSDGSKKPIKTIGDKFITLQSENFKNASQPLYAIISPDEKVLTLPVGYTPDVQDYANWLQCGLDAFKKVQ